MKQLLFLLLFPCLAMAQYQGNGNQKITLGEQTTADGLVWRGVENDTALITPFSDTSAYIILDTINNKFYNYNRSTNVWSLAGGGGGGGGIGTVTSITAGTGLTGGTITTSGTLAADTNFLVTRFDTSSMLTNYYRSGRALGIPSSGTLTNATGLPLTTGVTGTLGGANGGTGLTTFGAVGNIPFASSTTALKTNNTFWLLEFGGKGFLTLDGGNFRMRNQAQFQFFNLTNSYAWAAVVQGTTWQFQNDAGSNIMQMRGLPQRVGIGYNDTLSIDEKFVVNGNVKVAGLANAANPVNVQVDVNGVLVRTSSIDIKEDVQSLPYGLNEVMLLQPSKFSYIDKYKYGEGYDIGFIAQDVNNVIPEAVGTGIESDIFMDSVKLIPVLTKAIQEQQALIKALEQRILILENK